MAGQDSSDKVARGVAEGGKADRERQTGKGDNRTPDKTIGQVKYADNEGGDEQNKQAGSTNTTPGKQGGIAGP